MTRSTRSTDIKRRLAFGVAALAFTLPASAQLAGGPDETARYGHRDQAGNGAVVLYTETEFRGAGIAVDGSLPRLNDVNFNDRARSIEIRRGVWEICEDADQKGRCEIVDRSVADLRTIGLSGNISSIAPVAFGRGPRDTGAVQASGLTLYRDPEFRGEGVQLSGGVPDLSVYRFNDTASSATISGRGAWLLCEHPDYQGRCEIVSGEEAYLNDIGLNDNVSSARPYDARIDRAVSGPRGPVVPPVVGGPRGGYGGQVGGVSDGIRGERLVFFPVPTDFRGNRLPNGNGAATDFCRSRGFARGVYKADGRILSDVLCE